MPNIDPIAFQIGSFAIHWYGLMYLISFILASFAMRYRIKKYPQYNSWDKKQIDDLLFYCILGVVIGGRIGYILFYQFSYYSENILEVFKVWRGGMSFHGGLIGVLLACFIFGVKTKRTFFEVTDFIAPVIPIGLFFGRLGNFINGELWGRITTSNWGVIFPASKDGLPRHPSQLYEMFSEGLILFIILWVYLHRPRTVGVASGLFLFFYGLFRFVVEYYREPDAFLGLQMLDLTRGQWLCIPMILGGLLILFLKEIQGLWKTKLFFEKFRKKKKD